jgi:hypothetical protein
LIYDNPLSEDIAEIKKQRRSLWFRAALSYYTKRGVSKIDEREVGERRIPLSCRHYISL